MNRTSVADHFPSLAVWAEYEPEFEGVCNTLERLRHSNGVFALVQDEVTRQQLKWGDQSHPDVDDFGAVFQFDRLFHGVVAEDTAKLLCEAAADRGETTWADILTEEVAEAYAAKTYEHRREELVQVMAVCASWIRDLDRRNP